MRTRGRTPGGTPTRMPTVTPSTPSDPRRTSAPSRNCSGSASSTSTKPAGPSSHQLSAWVRDAINETLATLDPDGSPIHGSRTRGRSTPKVTGCLPTLTGDATRAAQVFLEGSKEYVSVLELHGSPPADFRDVVAEFEAEIYQKPPRKSAVTRRLRTRTIYDLDVLEVDDRQALSSGSGVSPGRTSGSCVTTSASRRASSARTWAISAAPPPTRSTTATCTPLQDLVDGLTWAEGGDDAFLREVVRPAEDALVHLPSVTIAPSAARNVVPARARLRPGVIDVDSVSEGGEGDDGDDTDRDPRSSPATP